MRLSLALIVLCAGCASYTPNFEYSDLSQGPSTSQPTFGLVNPIEATSKWPDKQQARLVESDNPGVPATVVPAGHQFQQVYLMQTEGPFMSYNGTNTANWRPNERIRAVVTIVSRNETMWWSHHATIRPSAFSLEFHMPDGRGGWARVDRERYRHSYMPNSWSQFLGTFVLPDGQLQPNDQQPLRMVPPSPQPRLSQ